MPSPAELAEPRDEELGEVLHVRREIDAFRERPRRLEQAALRVLRRAALAYEKDADAVLTYSQTVDRETQRMTAEESAKTLANANPGAPSPPAAPKPPDSGNGAVLVVGALTLAAAGGAVWWFSSSKK